MATALDPALAAQIAAIVASMDKPTDWTGVASAITAVGIIIIGVYTIYAQNRTQRKIDTVATTVKQDTVIKAAERKADKADAEVALQIVGAQLTAVEHKADSIHVLVNSNYGVQLQAVAVALETIAEMKNSEDATKAAQAARRAYDDHISRQAASDAQSMGVSKEATAKALLIEAEAKATKLREVAAEVAAAKVVKENV
jgi:hypothetical protein